VFWGNFCSFFIIIYESSAHGENLKMQNGAFLELNFQRLRAPRAGGERGREKRKKEEETFRELLY